MNLMFYRNIFLKKKHSVYTLIHAEVCFSSILTTLMTCNCYHYLVNASSNYYVFNNRNYLKTYFMLTADDPLTSESLLCLDFL